mmetsp:Transcript_17274/g.24004  ORF Transcript_17274/g.24004 Transcript_17274/m.24004 type:complete len:222 (+) Transcript_17274:74-739(+)
MGGCFQKPVVEVEFKLNMPDEMIDHTFRIFIEGDHKTGKTTLLWRWTEGTFPTEAEINSINFEKPDDEWEESEFKKRIIKIEQKKKKTLYLKVFFKVGKLSRESSSLRTQSFRNPYRGMDAVIVVCDTTNKQSLNWAKERMKDIKQYAKADVVKALLINKIDQNPRKSSITKSTEDVSSTFTNEMAENNFRIYEASAQTGTNVEETLQAVLLDVIRAKQHI